MIDGSKNTSARSASNATRALPTPCMPSRVRSIFPTHAAQLIPPTRKTPFDRGVEDGEGGREDGDSRCSLVLFNGVTEAVDEFRREEEEEEEEEEPEVATEASNPTHSTASMSAEASIVPVADAELSANDAEADSTPGTLRRAFWTVVPQLF